MVIPSKLIIVFILNVFNFNYNFIGQNIIQLPRTHKNTGILKTLMFILINYGKGL